MRGDVRLALMARRRAVAGRAALTILRAAA
jgi:hypothetical protein